MVNMLLISVDTDSIRDIGSQIRNKNHSLIGNNVDFQTSGMPLATTDSSPIVDNPPDGLMANLIPLAKNQEPGAVLLSVGSAQTNGVWALFKLLQNYIGLTVISNPFLLTTNKKKARLQIGETRRAITNTFTGNTGQPVANPAFADIQANLDISIVPKITPLGAIEFDLALVIDTFTDAFNPLSANKDIRSLSTHGQIGKNEVLAIGGIVRTAKVVSIKKVPILGDIPLIGTFFKNESHTIARQNLLVLIEAEIITPKENGESPSTAKKIENTHTDLRKVEDSTQQKDPIHRVFFEDVPDYNNQHLHNFLNNVHEYRCLSASARAYCDNACKNNVAATTSAQGMIAVQERVYYPDYAKGPA